MPMEIGNDRKKDLWAGSRDLKVVRWILLHAAFEPV